MDWIRKVSLVRRVVIGFTVMGLWCAALGAAAIWALQPGRSAAGTAIGIAAAVGCLSAGSQAG